MNFSSLDVLIIVLYMTGIMLFGIFSGGRQKSARDYFLSESSIPWWAVCFAIVATETSALTFISIPGIAYVGNFNFLQLTFGYLLGRLLIARFFIPAYFEGELSTAYAFLERRFGPRLRRATSIVFMGTRTFADGVRLYTTAIPLALLLRGFHILPEDAGNIFYFISISIMTVVTLVYVYAGGVRAVIWTDVIQMFIYLVGALLSCLVLLELTPGGMDRIISVATGAGKMSIFNFHAFGGLGGFFSEPYTFAGSVLGGMFLSMASHGTDHLIVQRILTTNSIAGGRKAMIGSGIIVMFQFLIFLFIGTQLWVYHGGTAISPNEVFPLFIIQHIPSGISGLIIAGLLAAAMSTLSGSISALSSATMMDIVAPLSKRVWDGAETLRWSRRFSLGWSLLLLVVASLFINTPKTVVEIALSIASYTYGGLLGVFLLGILFRRVHEKAALAGLSAGVVGMAVIILTTPLAWTWYTMTGTLITCLTALVYERFIQR